MTSGHSKPYIQQLWSHSLCAAVISQEIMKHLGKEIEMGYLTTLLHDLGKVVLLDNYALLALNKTLPPSEHLLSRRDEFDRFSLTHDTVGSWFLREKTRFPQAMQEAIERHHQIPSPKEPELTRLLFFSNRLAHEEDRASKPSYESLELGSLLWNLSSKQINAILEKSKEAVQQVKETYKIEQ
jgi:HD-like signal output (HDOD) protein